MARLARQNRRATYNGSTLLFSREEGEEGRGECMDGALGRASHGRIAVRPYMILLSVLYRAASRRAQRTHTAFFKGEGRRR